jgi:hypothetical protein
MLIVILFFIQILIIEFHAIFLTFNFSQDFNRRDVFFLKCVIESSRKKSFNDIRFITTMSFEIPLFKIS